MWSRLSSPIDQLRVDPASADETRRGPRHFDVVVVGSGYGAAVAALRLARCSKDSKSVSVCVLERGREFLPGEFPDTLMKVAGQVQIDTPAGHHSWAPRVGNGPGLYDLRLNQEVGALVGCGLGGTSLINANVVIETPAEVLCLPHWPQAFRNADEPLPTHWAIPGPTTPLADADPEHPLRHYYDRAAAMLQPAPFESLEAGAQASPPASRPNPKREALAAAGGTVVKPPIAVTPDWEDAAGGNRPSPGRVSSGGRWQPACTRCGNCVTGCNAGAKNVLTANYLPAARVHGAEIFTEVSVRYLQREDDRWLVHCAAGQRGEPIRVSADVVVLGAGTLGSNEILLRSRGMGLSLSGRLGQRFSANGDSFSVGYHQAAKVLALGAGEAPLGATADKLPGPCITGLVPCNAGAPAAERFIVEDAAVPGGLTLFFAELMSLLRIAAPARLVKRKGLAAIEPAQAMLFKGPDPAGISREALERTQLYLGIGHDDAGGELLLESDRLRIRWPRAGEQPSVVAQNDLVEKWVGSLGGTFVPNAAWELKKSLFTVHPMGGCRMADRAEDGVVDEFGRLYEGTTGTATHPGLIACDGAILPGSLGANPLLTICALAERCVEQLAADRGWVYDGAAAPHPPEDAQPFDPPATPSAHERHTILEFDESLEGSASEAPAGFDLARAVEAGDPLPFARAAERAADRQPEVGNFRYENGRLRIADLDRFLDGALSDYTAEAVRGGRVHVDLSGSEEIFEVIGGTVRLLSPDGAGRRIRYELELARRGEEEPVGILRGFKLVYDDPGADWWGDLTTLFAGVQYGAKVAIGVIRLSDQGLLQFLNPKVRPNGAGEKEPTRTQSFLARLRLMAFFARAIGLTYWRELLDPAAQAQAAFAKLLGGALPPEALALAGLASAPRGPLKARCRTSRGLIAPEVFHFDVPRELPGTPADDSEKITLRLTRYRLDRNTQSANGPVLLLHGFAGSNLTFTLDSIEVNLAEFLCERDYDVWVLEYRASTLLPACREQFDLDQIADIDLPEAIDFVRRAVAGRDREAPADDLPPIRVIGHCMGSETLCTSLLKGNLVGRIAAAVCMQIGPHVVGSKANMTKWRLAQMLKGMGVRFLDTRPGAGSPLLDHALRTWRMDPRERCDSACCRRVTAYYGQLYRHANILRTHERIGELIGIGNVKTFEHLAHMFASGKLVDASGEIVYSRKENLRAYLDFPIAFVHAEFNGCFLPESTEKSIEELREINPGQLYERHLVSDYGHLDCVIGDNAAHDVFPRITAFFDKARGFQPDRRVLSAIAIPEPELALPAVGPIVGHTTDCSVRVWIRGAPAASAELRTVGVAALYGPDGEPIGAAKYFRLHREQERAGVVDFTVEEPERGEYTVRVATLIGALPSGQGENDAAAYATFGEPESWRAQLAAADAGGAARFRFLLRAAEPAEPAHLRFLLGSCRHPGTHGQQAMSDRIFATLGDRLREPEKRPDFLLLVGDQIYADPGPLMDVADEPEDFRRLYRNAFGGCRGESLGRVSPNAHAVLSELPTWMILDDHEIQDNWDPARARADRASRSLERAALKAAFCYQRMAGPGGPVWPGDPQAVAFHYEFAAAGFPFFVLDVRTRRDRKRGDLLGAAQWDEFARWLARVAADPRPKFIVSPTPFVPNIHPTLEDRRLGDSWAAFPASRKWLLAMLVEQQVRNVVFLSGDSHFSNVARLDFFTAGGERIDLNAFSITASPLFNPFEGLGRVSSHAVRDSRTDGDAFTFATGNYGEVAMNYTAQCFVEQDNFVAVQLDWDGSRPALQVDILDRYGQPCPRLDAPGSYAQVTL